MATTTVARPVAVAATLAAEAVAVAVAATAAAAAAVGRGPRLAARAAAMARAAPRAPHAGERVQRSELGGLCTRGADVGALHGVAQAPRERRKPRGALLRPLRRPLRRVQSDLQLADARRVRRQLLSQVRRLVLCLGKCLLGRILLRSGHLRPLPGHA